MTNDLLFLYLRDNDAECPVCGYGLHGLTTPVCPECGVEVELGVRANDPMLRIWIAGLITASLPTGFFLFFLGLVGLASLVGVGVPPFRELWPTVVGGVLGSAAIVLLIAQRRRFRAVSKSTRARLVVALGLLMAALFASQVYLMF
jgi:hypothetical protein